MAVAAACCVAVLTAISLEGFLRLIQTGREKRSKPHGAAAGLQGPLVGVVASWGKALACSGILPARVVERLAGELRGLRFRHREPFSGLADAEAMGVVALASLGMGALLGLFSWSLPGFLLGCVALPVLLWVRATRRKRAEEAAIAQAMPEAFGALAISLESGLSLAQAMRYVGSHSEEPVRGQFMQASFAMSCGVSAAEALDAMVGSLSAPGLELVSLALKISQRTGAPLKDLLAEASQLAGDRIELARHLDVKTAQARMSAQLVGAMPVAMAGVLALLSSDFRSGLATGAGAAALGIALGLNALAWVIIQKIMRVEL